MNNHVNMETKASRRVELEPEALNQVAGGDGRFSQDEKRAKIEQSLGSIDFPSIDLRYTSDDSLVSKRIKGKIFYF